MLGFWARAGVAESTTPSDQTESRVNPPGPAFGDNIGSMTLAGGIAAALFHHARTGEGTVVDVSLLGAGMWSMGSTIALSQSMGFPWKSGPSTNVGSPSNPLTGAYRTKDGRFIAFSMLQGFHYWPEVCTLLDRPELIDDERFNDQERFMANGAEGSQVMADILVEHTLEELKARFTGMKGQWAVVQNTLEIAEDPMVEANGYLLPLETSDGTPFTLVATPVQFDEEPAKPARSPDFNEQGDTILTGMLGLDWDAVVDLKVRGVVA
jgi:crotonobetainyl-CoA:carnitine CoA-transferase CaiB-like acyl-CoA transferase